MKKAIIVISFIVLLITAIILINLYIEMSLNDLTLLVMAVGTLVILGAIFVAIYNRLSK